MNFKEKQEEIFMKILHISKLNSQLEFQQLEKFSNNWKILIYDNRTFNYLVSSKTGDLRENNVTMHLNINQSKEELLGIEAIYFVTPNQDNFNTIIYDLQKNYFDQFYICFSSAVQKEDFEKFCTDIIRIKKTSLVKRIIQINLSHFLINDKSFNFLLPSKYNNEILIDSIFNLIMFTGKDPIFMYEKNDTYAYSIYQSIKQKNLENQFYTEKKNSDNDFIIYLQSNQQDYLNMLHHFTYFQLIFDNFDILKSVKQFNSFQIDDQKISLDFLNDKFFQENSSQDYPTVGDRIYSSLQEWKKKYEKYTNKSDDNDFSDNFNEAIENLPQITEEKKQYYQHLKISSKLLKLIDERGLEKFATIGNKVVKDKNVSQEHYLETKLLMQNEKFNSKDKIRLFTVLGVYGNMNTTQFDELFQLLKKSSQLQPQEENFLEKFKEQYRGKNVEKSLIGSLTNQSLNFVNRLIKSQYQYKSTQIIQDVFKNKQSEEIQFDREISQEQLVKIKTILVLKINGGNLLEMEELFTLSKSINKEIFYGVDYLQKIEDLIEQNNQFYQWKKIKQIMNFTLQHHKDKNNIEEISQNDHYYQIFYSLIQQQCFYKLLEVQKIKEIIYLWQNTIRNP